MAICAHVVEARVTFACSSCLLGIDALEVLDHRFDRSAQAVEVETVEADLGRRARLRVVARPQPLDERQHVAVSPHPRREATKAFQRSVRVAVVGVAQHVSVNPVGVRPVSFDGHRVETQFVNESSRDSSTFSVEFVRSVRGFADEYESTSTNEPQ